MAWPADSWETLQWGRGDGAADTVSAGIPLITRYQSIARERGLFIAVPEYPVGDCYHA